MCSKNQIGYVHYHNNKIDMICTTKNNNNEKELYSCETKVRNLVGYSYSRIGINYFGISANCNPT